MLLCATIAAGSLGVGQEPQPRPRPVDPGVSDMGPLSAGGRVLPRDMRQPANFERVYEVEINGRRYFARQHAGTTAVFERSDYLPTRAGLFPLIPGGTRYYIGRLPAARSLDAESSASSGSSSAARSAAAGAPVRSPDRAGVQLAVPSAPRPLVSARTPGVTAPRPEQPGPALAAPAPRDPVRSVWTHESYRIERTAALLDAARTARLAD